MQRSKKYSEMSDEQIILAYSVGPVGENKWYLDLELDCRGIREKAESARKIEIKRSKKPITFGRVAFFALLLLIFGSKLFHRLFG